jgi:hypothetical protein
MNTSYQLDMIIKVDENLCTPRTDYMKEEYWRIT